MRPISDAFLRTLRGSHRMATRVRVCTTYQEGVDPDGEEIAILGGDVELDGTAAIRSTVDLTVEPSLWPTTAGSLLAPYGNELFIERGIYYGGGSYEWVSLGYFRIEAPDQDDVPTGPIRVAGKDRMAGLIDARLVAPVQMPAASTFGGVTEQLVTDVYPDATIEWDDTTVRDTTIGRSLICERERADFLQDLWASLGKIGYWDHRGILVVSTVPDPDEPVWEINHGQGGVLVSMSRQLTRSGVYNALVVTGEAADTADPPRAVAIDDNPDSPTWWYGRFGQVPQFYTSSFITTAGQAQTAAQEGLRKKLGLPYNVDFGVIVNPALEPWDPVLVRYSDRARAEKHVAEKLRVPLSAEAAMTGSTREQTTVLIGVS